MKASECRTAWERHAYLQGVVEANSRVMAAFAENPGSSQLDILNAIEDKLKELLAEVEQANNEVAL